jgi:S-adenosylmethionine/arginine decarboxylase-like enzyme
MRDVKGVSKMSYGIDYNRVGPFRQRLCVDCYGVDATLLGKIDHLHQFMNELTKRIGMRVLVPPIIVQVPVVNAYESIATETDCGLSGTVVCSCSVHT